MKQFFVYISVIIAYSAHAMDIIPIPGLIEVTPHVLQVLNATDATISCHATYTFDYINNADKVKKYTDESKKRYLTQNNSSFFEYKESVAYSDSDSYNKKPSLLERKSLRYLTVKIENDIFNTERLCFNHMDDTLLIITNPTPATLGCVEVQRPHKKMSAFFPLEEVYTVLYIKNSYTKPVSVLPKIFLESRQGVTVSYENSVIQPMHLDSNQTKSCGYFSAAYYAHSKMICAKIKEVMLLLQIYDTNQKSIDDVKFVLKHKSDKTRVYHYEFMLHNGAFVLAEK